MSKIAKSITWNDALITLETGEIARLADAAVRVSVGETIVLCTVCIDDVKDDSYLDTAALHVSYQEKFYSAGKIPGGFLKREGKPSQREVLISTVIDRIFRPLIPKESRNVISIVCTLLSYSGYKTDFAAVLGVSAAMMIAGLPFAKPIVMSSFEHKDDSFAAVTQYLASGDSCNEITVAYSEDTVVMIEATLSEIRPEIIADMVSFGHKSVIDLFPFLKDFASLVLEKKGSGYALKHSDSSSEDGPKGGIEATLKNVITESAATANAISNFFKHERSKGEIDSFLDSIKHDFFAMACLDDKAPVPHYVKGIAFDLIFKDAMIKALNSNGRRIDGRLIDEIRSIDCKVNYLPKTHGAALFTRGYTQVLSVVTLGTDNDRQMYESAVESGMENFMLHYNFPQFSVGEINISRGLGRREIGHGNLASQAFQSSIKGMSFSHTIRVVADVLESDGSSSMATVCASSLAMMCAGVPIKKHVAGVAMGLVKNGNDFVVLSDINEFEDKFGNMDFKVAGTLDGITAIQMDIKNITGLPIAVVKEVLERAFQNISGILKLMYDSIPSHNTLLNANVPQIKKFKVEVSKIKEIIGARGKVIKEICEKTKAKVDIQNDGVMTVSGSDSSIVAAYEMVSQITGGNIFDITSQKGVGPDTGGDVFSRSNRRNKADAPNNSANVSQISVQVGEVYNGVISNITKFGASVDFANTDGFIHISNISDQYVKSVSACFKVGQNVYVKVIEIDHENKRIKLGTKGVDQRDGAAAGGKGNSEENDLVGQADNGSNKRHDSAAHDNSRSANQGNGNDNKSAAKNNLKNGKEIRKLRFF